MHAYLKLCTEFYDLDKPDAPAEALAFYARLAGEAHGPILEPMCGSGRFLIPLLERGFDVDGTDLSEHMLQACRDKAASRGLNLRVQRRALHQLDVPRRYTLVLIPSGSFQLIIDLEHVRQSLRRIFEVLLPGGKLVLETSPRKPAGASAGPWGGRWVQRPDGARIIISWLGSYEPATSISHSINRYELIQAGKLLESEFEELDLRHYDLKELMDLLARSGFERIRAMKCFDASSPPDKDDEQVVVECMKP